MFLLLVESGLFLISKVITMFNLYIKPLSCYFISHYYMLRVSN